MTRPLRAGLPAGLLGLALALPATAALAAPAGAAPAPATVTCIQPARGHRGVPAVHRHRDTTRVTRRDLRALAPTRVLRRLSRRQGFRSGPAAQARTGAGDLPPRVVIPVYVHVIKGRHRGERVPAGPRRVHRLIRILNGGFHGGQAADSPRTRYTFRLRHIDYTRRDGWYHAFLNGPRDKRMKRHLHRGGRGTLNLYLNGGGPKHGAPVLGWSRFPWQYRHAPRLDGVTVNVAALPGGRARHYNRGDTAIHETGHWMGLFHTFQGGCGGQGDRVADTPAEAKPSYRCETARDTCLLEDGTDPVHNFMDYSYDSCMDTFTPDQVLRMDSAFARWRR